VVRFVWCSRETRTVYCIPVRATSAYRPVAFSYLRCRRGKAPLGPVGGIIVSTAAYK
jgi:hypothetical protein